MAIDISIKRGSRAFICGTAGSGKTTFALKLCEAMPAPLVILDTKYDPSIAKWARANRVKMITRKMPDWRTIKDDCVIRPGAEWIAHPEDLDWWLGEAFKCKFSPSIYIDEGYQVGATSTKMGVGVTGLWTRSRALGFRCLIGAQRPVRISSFVISESDVLFIGRLNKKDDRKKIVDDTGDDAALHRQEPYHFLYIRQDGSDAIRLKPIDVEESSIYVPAKRNETRTLMPREKRGLIDFLKG